MSSDAWPASPTKTGSKNAGLVIVSTPIGNGGDITHRAAATLAEADLVLCEDTRTTGRLLAHLGIRARTQALHDHNEDGRIAAVLEAIGGGALVALVSDAGTPLLSDPGYRLVRALLAAGVRVTAAPGPNAAITALTLSGLPPHPFLFLGFPPPREAARRAAFAELRAAERAGLRATLIWHEAPHRLLEMLGDLDAVFGARPAAVARELTKRFEEVRRGTPADLLAHFTAEAPRGEITVLLGPGEAEIAGADAIDAALAEAERTMSVKDAAAAVSGALGLPRKVVYARALARRRGEVE